MAVTPKPLGQAQAGLTGSPTTVYTVPAGKTATLWSLSLCSHDTARRTVRLCKVPLGGSFGAGTDLLWDAPVDPGIPVEGDAIRVLEAGGTIQISADVAVMVTLTVDGAEVDN